VASSGAPASAIKAAAILKRLNIVPSLDRALGRGWPISDLAQLSPPGASARSAF
jgi:hypothetical protein